MNEKELREIKRRFRPNKNSIFSIKGCLVNEKREIVKLFEQPMSICTEDESEKLLGTMKKVLSGGMGTNMIDISFTPQQVMESAEHKLLMELKKTGLNQEEPVIKLFETIAENAHVEGSFVILLASDNYDVYSYSKDGEKQDSTEVFSYIMCCVCPVKPLKSGLYFRSSDSTFRAIGDHNMLGNPLMGFMFPSFDDRATNIYNALYYTRDVSDVHPAFIQSVFNVDLPMSATEQKDTFDSCLRETLEGECDFQVVRSVHDQISEMVQEHKDTKQEEPLKLSKSKLKTVLEYCGVDQEKVEQFGEKFDEQFGKNAEIEPKSIVDVKKFQVSMPDVSIKVNPERTDLVSTQIINGVKYIMICVNDAVEVNGVKIDIQ